MPAWPIRHRSALPRCPSRPFITDPEQLTRTTREHEPAFGGRWTERFQTVRVIQPQRTAAGAQHERIALALHRGKRALSIADHERWAQATGRRIEPLVRHAQRDASELCAVLAPDRNEAARSERSRGRFE